MEKISAERRNFSLYAVREGAYTAAMPFINGTLVQLFLAHKDIAPERIGLFNTILYIVNIGFTMLLSNLAEKKPNALLRCNRLLLAQAALYLGFFAAFLPMQSGGGGLFLVVLAAASVQMAMYSCKYIYEYKLLYQIIDIERYGALASFTGVVIGLMGAGFGWICARIIESGNGDTPYLIGMLLTEALLITAFLSAKRLKIVNHSFDSPREKPFRAEETVRLLRSPIFRKFVVPNILRGVTIGITNSIALIALGMGYTEGIAARLAVMSSFGYIAGSVFYHIFERKVKPVTMGLIGSGLLCAMTFLPHSSNTALQLLFLIAFFGRILVDYSVPVMVFHMIDPEISGAYNAWRNVLFSLTAAGVSYAVGALVGRVNPLWLLVPGAAAYGISMICYGVLYKKFGNGTGGTGE